MSHILFVDESRIGHLGISCLGGLLVSETDYRQAHGTLRAVKLAHLHDEHAPVKWSPSDSETMYTLQRALQPQTALREAVCDLLGASSCHLMFACIDEQSVSYTDARRQTYLLQGLEYLCQRTQMHLQSLSGRARIVMDLPGNFDGHVARRYFELHRDGSSSPQFAMQFDRLDRELTFTHEFLSDGLQLVDCAVGAFAQSVKQRGDQYLDRFRRRVRRHPQSGAIKGAGVVVYPSNSTIVDATCRFCQQP